MAIVRIPSPLRRYTNSQAKVSIGGENVSEIINNLEAAHPGVKNRICDESGQIKRYVNIFVNQDEIRTLQGAESSVGENDEVSIVPAMAGGVS